MENTSVNVLVAATRAATTTSADFTNYNSRGIHLVVDVTVVPGVDTVTPKIQGMINGIYYDLLVGSAIVATGTTVLKIYPGIAASANVSASDVLPEIWRVVMTHSAASTFNYTVSANLIA